MTNAATLLRVTATLRRFTPGPPDEFNNPTDGFTESTVSCALQMRARQEIDEGAISTTTWVVLFAPSVPPPKAADQLVVDGTTYQFRGDCWLAYGTRGQADHVEGTLELAV